MNRRKYKTDEEAKAAQRAQAKAWRQKNGRKKKGGKSWLKSLETKLDEAASEGTDQTPPDRPGEPFADLPPLDLPGTVPAADSTSESTVTDQAPSSDVTAPSAESADKKAKTDKEAFLNTEQLQQMAQEGMYAATMFLGQYAAARGQFALGEVPCKLAGKAAAVLVKTYAKDLDIDDETGSAWVIGGVVGVNGVQAFRAYKIEKDQKEKEEAKPHVQPQREQRAEQPNGAPSPTAVPPPHFVPSEKAIIVRPGELV